MQSGERATRSLYNYVHLDYIEYHLLCTSATHTDSFVCLFGRPSQYVRK